MAFIAAWIAKLGLGWMFSWATGGFFGGIIAAIGAMLSQLFEVLGMVAKWLLKTFFAGVDHIIKSVPAVFVVISLAWAGYGYGKFVAPVEKVVIERRVEVPVPAGEGERRKTIFEEVFGGR